MRFSPGHSHLPNPMLLAPDPRHPRVQDRSELAAVQMAPTPLGLMVVQRADDPALGTCPLGLIQSFFLEAFAHVGGQLHRREPGRFEITHVPACVRERDRLIGRGAPVLPRYERVCFDKAHLGRPRAHLVSPGAPLLSGIIDLVLERHGQQLKRGAVLVDERDLGQVPRLLFYLEHAVQDGRRVKTGSFQVVSLRLHFVEVGPDGVFRNAGAAPYLDYRAATPAERALNVPDRFRLAIVKVQDDRADEPVYVADFDYGQPVFGQTSATYSLKELLRRGGAPR